MWTLSSGVELANDNVPAVDAERQQKTAAEILRRFTHQPGLILADEVGMGKTFVALAVAASVVRAAGHEQPVVVMVPPSVADKWPREWATFAEKCMSDASDIRVSGAVRHGIEFLKLLDDPPDRRKHIIFLTHGALNRTTNDPFVRLALLRRAGRRRAELQKKRPAIAKNASVLLGDKRFKDEELIGWMLETPENKWMDLWNKYSNSTSLDDDPVPAAFVDAIDNDILEPLRDALALLPMRQSANFDARLAEAKAALTKAMRDAWTDSLRKLDVHLPLLILDEAHHVKNDNTMSSLFANEAEEDAEALKGPLGGMFDRMLFLTATPFQLGHHELLSVLGRFDGVRWQTAEDRKAFKTTVEDLGNALDSSRSAAIQFEKRWSAIDPVEDASLVDLPSFDTPERTGLSSAARAAVTSGAVARIANSRAAAALRPWVIRHLKPNDLERRRYRAGAAVLDSSAGDIGLPISNAAALPFLLAGRADAVARLSKDATGSTRSLFSYGIASSFEAYRNTRSSGAATTDDTETPAPMATVSGPVKWYLDRIEKLLPDDPASHARHPKIAATVERTLQLWDDGEKVLVFCFYRETGKALRLHIARALQKRTTERAAAALSIDPSDPSAVSEATTRLSARLLRSDGAGYTRIRDTASSWAPMLDEPSRRRLGEVVVRFLRTESFLVRFTPLSPTMTVDDLLAGLETVGAGGVSLRRRIESFAVFLSRRPLEDRERILEILMTTRTGDITVDEGDTDEIDPGEQSSQQTNIAPNVRLANGEVARETRQRLMASFNSPFFPDVLIASSVMAEGVDLHTACRHVIHHDLDWNPATLEQRTGRLDRLGSAALLAGEPVIVYEPYLGGTHDERMYRVVKDRERWFGVVMGDTRTKDDADDQSEKLPLPSALIEELTMDLAVT
ncbi:helicase-related protein [Rhodococcus sp. NPDC057297]|uniref:helicase-related protein n=1 Tax=Rhodococcus sp. NPDC057297 TaxID=3346090 RepID=UPI003640018B